MNGGSSSSGIAVEKLVGNNYNYWRLCMEAFLQGQDLWDLIEGDDTSIPEDTSQNVELRRKWKIKCGKALFALRTSISKEYIDHVRDLKSLKQVWETLQQLFTKKNTARLQFLENELALVTQGNLSIEEYFLKVKNLCSEISELDVEEPVSDARLRRYLIRGLRKDLMPFVSSIQGWANQPSIFELENLLSNQEALIKQMTSTKLSSKSEDVLFVKDQRRKIFYSKPFLGDRNQSRSEEQPKRSVKSCYRCGKLGHIKQDCRVKVVCDRCGKPGHIKANCRVKMQEEAVNVVLDNNEFQQPNWEQCLSIEVFDQPRNVTSLVHQDDVPFDTHAFINYDEEWIVDSGCSHHAIGNDTLLSDVRPHHMKKVIVTADNSLHPVTKEGDLNDGGVFLKDVYHVPGLRKNLAYVSQITDSGRYVLFGPNDVQILSNIKHIAADVLFCGRRKESLYVLSASDEYVKKAGHNTSSTLWHARLGHVGFQLLQKISKNQLLDGIPIFKDFHYGEICPGFQYGKSHRLPFSSSKSEASVALQLVHSDLLGPTRTPSYTGFHYVMVIVDDFSRFSWVYFLKHKSEAFSKFVQFKHEVEKELGLPIKCLRTDNGGEFLSDEFMDYCREHVIQRQMTCPDTPQQNGVAERKLAHLTSICLSWLHAKNLPRELWAAAFQTACHVINRLPPWPGTKPSPFERLYHHKPNVSYFRIFGSVGYVHVLKQNRTKLDPKAKKCIFVGYDTYRKGWRCMDSETKKIIISRDVVFDEVSRHKDNGDKGTTSLPLFLDDVPSIEGCT
ncbi:hypothetical protein HRI_003346600 [Hibiscus trionum]|uniref:Retrovirus-related Pol polyprotein from transposon TNT 1-94 n=1 Tax=Hibiscus trionum TaxID=183268 RepID=A0A9W7IMG8_HIBTR|nr:hypothetical protein HRI_003346600 [Hibiscus trionum]